MNPFDLDKLRANSTVLIVAPRASGKSGVLAQLLDARAGPHVLVDGKVQTQEQCLALLEGELEGKTVVLDHLPLCQLPAQRCGALRAALHKELEIDLFVTAASLGQVSTLELRNADYLFVRSLGQRDYRRLAKLCGHSMKKLARAQPLDGWLVIDRRSNRLYEFEDPLAAAAPTAAAEAAPEQAAPAADEAKSPAEAEAQGVWSYVASWFGY